MIIAQELQTWIKSGFELKYTEAAIQGAIENNPTEVLKWWLASGLNLKYHNLSFFRKVNNFPSIAYNTIQGY